jgi:hypothetical protein
MDKYYDIQKHLTTINTVAILITIGLFDKMEEKANPDVISNVINLFLISLVFSLGSMSILAVTIESDLGKSKMLGWLATMAIPLTIFMSWGCFLVGIILLAKQF